MEGEGGAENTSAGVSIIVKLSHLSMADSFNSWNISGGGGRLVSEEGAAATRTHQSLQPEFYMEGDKKHPFVGRAEILKNIREALVTGRQGGEYKDEAKDVYTNACVIVGMAGVGKSTLARQIVQSRRIRHHFHYIQWIDATSKETMNASINDLVLNRLDLETHKRAETHLWALLRMAYSKLLTRRTLLVFDNAGSLVDVPGFYDGICRYLPNLISLGSIYPRVLITTRNTVGWDWPILVFPLEEWTLAECTEIIHSRYGKVLREESESLINQFAVFLDKLPEGIDYGVNVIELKQSEDKRYKIRDFLNEYKSLADFISRDVLPPTSLGIRGLRHLWETDLRKLVLLCQGNNTGLNLLNVVYMLASSGNKFEYISELYYRVFPENFRPGQGKQELWNTLHACIQLSLVKPLKGDGIVKVNKLILATAWNNLRERRECHEGFVLNTFEALQNMLEDYQDNAEIIRFIWDALYSIVKDDKTKGVHTDYALELLIQATEILKFINPQSVLTPKLRPLLNSPTLTTNFLPNELRATYHFLEGNYDAALALYGTTLRERENEQSTRIQLDDEITLRLRWRIGNVLMKQKEYQRALLVFSGLYESTSSKQSFLYREGKGYLSNMQYVIAKIHQIQGNPHEALLIYHLMYEQRKLVRGNSDISCHNILQKMALLFLTMGHCEDAYQAFEDVYTFRCLQNGPRHVYSLEAAFFAAFSLQKMRDGDKAVKFYKEKILQEEMDYSLPPPNENAQNDARMRSLQKIVEIYESQHCLHKSLVLYEMALEDYKKTSSGFDEDELRVAEIEKKMALLLVKLGKLAAALESLCHVHAQESHFLGHEHPVTVDTYDTIISVTLKNEYTVLKLEEASSQQ